MWAIDWPNIKNNASCFRCKVCVSNRKANYVVYSIFLDIFVYVQPPICKKIKNGRSFHDLLSCQIIALHLP